MTTPKNTNVACAICNQHIYLEIPDNSLAINKLINTDLPQLPECAAHNLPNKDSYQTKNLYDLRKMVGKTLTNLNAKFTNKGDAPLVKHLLRSHTYRSNITKQTSYLELENVFQLTLFNHRSQTQQQKLDADRLDQNNKQIVITVCGKMMHYNCLIKSTEIYSRTAGAQARVIIDNQPYSPSSDNYATVGANALLAADAEEMVYLNTNDSQVAHYYCTCPTCCSDTKLTDGTTFPFALLLTPHYNPTKTFVIDPLTHEHPRRTSTGGESDEIYSTVFQDPNGQAELFSNSVSSSYGSVNQNTNQTQEDTHIYDHRNNDTGFETTLVTKLKEANILGPNLQLQKPSILCYSRIAHLQIPQLLHNLHNLRNKELPLHPDQNFTAKIATTSPNELPMKAFLPRRERIDFNASLSYADFVTIVDNMIEKKQEHDGIVVHLCGCTTGLSTYFKHNRPFRYIFKQDKSPIPQVSFLCPAHNRTSPINENTTACNNSVVIFAKNLLTCELLTPGNTTEFANTLKNSAVQREHKEICKSLFVTRVITNTTYVTSGNAPAEHIYDLPYTTDDELKHVHFAQAQSDYTDVSPIPLPDSQPIQRTNSVDSNSSSGYIDVAAGGQSIQRSNSVGSNASARYMQVSGAPDGHPQQLTIPAQGESSTDTPPRPPQSIRNGGGSATEHNPMYDNSDYQQQAIETLAAAMFTSDEPQFLTKYTQVAHFIYLNPRYSTSQTNTVSSIRPHKRLTWLQRNKRPVAIGTIIGMAVLGGILATTLAGSDDDSPTNTIPPDGGDPVNNNCFNYNASLGYIYDAISAQMPSFSSKNCRTVAEVLTPIIERVNATFSSSCRADFITATNGLVRSNNITLPIAQDIVLAFDNMIGHCPAPCVSELAPLVTSFTRVASSVGLSAIYSLSQVNGTLFINLPGGGKTPVDESTPYLDAIPPRLVSYAQSQGFDGVTDEASLIGLDNITENIIGTNLRLIDGLGAFNMCTPQLDLLESYINNIKDYIYNLALTEHLISSTLTSSSTGSTFTSTEPSSTSTSSSSSTTRPSLTTVSHVTGITTGTSMTPSVTTGTGITPSVTATTTTNIINSTISTLTTENSAITNPSEDDDA